MLTKAMFVWYNGCVGRPVRLLVFIGVLKWKDETEVNGVKHVIHIFGASGSGTSTLGREIASGLGYRFMDTDDYFWLPTDPKYTHKRPVSERLALMRQDITILNRRSSPGSSRSDTSYGALPPCPTSGG